MRSCSSKESDMKSITCGKLGDTGISDNSKRTTSIKPHDDVAKVILSDGSIFIVRKLYVWDFDRSHYTFTGRSFFIEKRSALGWLHCNSNATWFFPSENWVRMLFRWSFIFLKIKIILSCCDWNDVFFNQCLCFTKLMDVHLVEVRNTRCFTFNLHVIIKKSKNYNVNASPGGGRISCLIMSMSFSIKCWRCCKI